MYPLEATYEEVEFPFAPFPHNSFLVRGEFPREYPIVTPFTPVPENCWFRYGGVDMSFLRNVALDRKIVLLRARKFVEDCADKPNLIWPFHIFSMPTYGDRGDMNSIEKYLRDRASAAKKDKPDGYEARNATFRFRSLQWLDAEKQYGVPILDRFVRNMEGCTVEEIVHEMVRAYGWALDEGGGVHYRDLKLPLRGSRDWRVHARAKFETYALRGLQQSLRLEFYRRIQHPHRFGGEWVIQGDL